MNPIKFQGWTTNFGAPAGWDAQKNGHCQGLPTKVSDDNRILSVWQPSDHERIRIARGDNIVLTCFGVQPPVRLTVRPLREVPQVGLNFDGVDFIDEDDTEYSANPKLRELLQNSAPWEPPSSAFRRLFKRPSRSLFARLLRTMSRAFAAPVA